MRIALALLAAYLALAAAWVVRAGFARPAGGEGLLNVACDPTRELWRDLNARFRADYQARTGETVTIRQSHGGSGSQARAVLDGLDADVVTLALYTDTAALAKAGLIDAGWVDRFPNRSLPYTSTVVFVVRRGNPKGVRDWPDLLKPGVECVVPKPKTSGNGKWAFLAMWGSVRVRGGTDAEAEAFTRAVFRRVPVLDTAARAATMTFAHKRVGDVHLTWENEAHLEVAESNGELEVVVPPVSVLAEPHVAVVDANARRRGTEALADAYLRSLYTPEAQAVIASHRYRPIDPALGDFPAVERFRVADVFGDWAAVQERFFADGGVYDRFFDAGRP